MAQLELGVRVDHCVLDDDHQYDASGIGGRDVLEVEDDIQITLVGLA